MPAGLSRTQTISFRTTSNSKVLLLGYTVGSGEGCLTSASLSQTKDTQLEKKQLHWQTKQKLQYGQGEVMRHVELVNGVENV